MCYYWNAHFQGQGFSGLRMCRYLPPLSLTVLTVYRNNFTCFQLLVVCTASGMISLRDNFVHTAHSLVKDTYCLYVSPHWTGVFFVSGTTHLIQFYQLCHLITVILVAFIGLHIDSPCCYLACIVCFEIYDLCTVILSGNFQWNILLSTLNVCWTKWA